MTIKYVLLCYADDDNGLLCNVTGISAQVENRKTKKKDTG